MVRSQAPQLEAVIRKEQIWKLGGSSTTMPPIELADRNASVCFEEKWKALRDLASANPDFTPLEIKAFYFVGLMHDICRSVEVLMKSKSAWPELYLPAFSLMSSAVDILGRCISGNATIQVNENLRTGFWYLGNHQPSSKLPAKAITEVQFNAKLLESQGIAYTVSDLVMLRNYASHGQAAATKLSSVDNMLIEEFRDLIGGAMETYWTQLLRSKAMCERLGVAMINPHSNRAEPLIKTINEFSAGKSAGGLFFDLDWKVG